MLEIIVLYGHLGNSKSHIATAVGVAACSKGKRVKFVRTAVLGL